MATSSSPSEEGLHVQTKSCPPALCRASWKLDDFKIVKLLGEGTLSTVTAATCKASGIKVAIKSYHKDRMTGIHMRQVAREINIHSELCHPRICPLYAAFEDADGIHMVQELAEHGDVYASLARQGGFMLEDYVIQEVLVPVLQAVQYLHNKGVMHRDIKPENVLLTATGAKLADFGLAIDTSKELPLSRVGTLDYLAPEMVKLSGSFSGGALDQARGNYTSAVDIWCIGILVYELLVGGPPFEAPTK